MNIEKADASFGNPLQKSEGTNIKSNDPSQEIMKGFWSCPQCKENNLPSSHYCRNCGTENKSFSGSPNNEPQKKSWFRKSAVIILIVFILAAILAGGWFFYKKIENKKEARLYLTHESQSFSKSVALINDLSTEKELEYKNEDSKDIFLKRMEEERDRSGKALLEIKKSREINSQLPVNSEISSSDALLKKYYQEAEEKVDIYNQYLSYEYEVVKLDISIDKEMEKIDTIFRTSKDLKDVARSIREMQNIFNSFLIQYKLVVPPVGLEEAHNKDVVILEKMISSLDIVASGIEKSDLAEVQRGEAILDEAISDKNINEIEQLRDFYFEELHEKFSDLRGRADNIKTEFIKSGTVLKTEIAGINIEGW